MRNSFLCLFVFAVANMGAQNNMADILASIETNNPELKAGAQIVLSQKAEVSSQNTLEDPNFEFEHLWGADNAKDRKYDISVSQSFDFPSLYVQRNKIGNLKRTLYDGQQAVLRQQILLQAAPGRKSAPVRVRLSRTNHAVSRAVFRAPCQP